MIKTPKRKAPSRVRYEQGHPTVSCRLPRDIYDKLRAVIDAEGKSCADILKTGLGILEVRVKEEEEIRKKGHAEGYSEGYEEAEHLYKVTYPCNVCGRTMTVTSGSEKEAINKYMKARRLWATILSKRLDNFSQRQLHQRLRRSFSLDEITDALQTLEYLGYIWRIPSEAVGKVGRPASPVFQVNPLACTQNPQNTQNSGDDANYEDSVYAQQIPQEQKVNNKVDEEPDTACTENTHNHKPSTKPEQEDEKVPDWF